MTPSPPTRIALLGNSGSGKSTLARRLAARRGVPALDLDTIAFEPDAPGVRRPLTDSRRDLEAFCAGAGGWIVEGCYAQLIALALARGAELWFLDPGVQRCLAHCRARPWEPHKYPSEAEQDARLPFLLEWVAEYETRDDELSRSAHEALFRRHPGPKRRLDGPALDAALAVPGE